MSWVDYTPLGWGAKGVGYVAGRLSKGADWIKGELSGEEDKEILEQAGREYDPRIRGVLEQLGAQASGRRSIVEGQLRQALGRQVGAQQSMAASARPGQSALAQRMAAQGIGRAQTEMSGQAAIARMQEQKEAQRLLAEYLAQLRAQEIGRAGAIAKVPGYYENIVSAVKATGEVAAAT